MDGVCHIKPLVGLRHTSIVSVGCGQKSMATIRFSRRNEVWPRFHFLVNSPDVFAQNSSANKLDTADK